MKDLDAPRGSVFYEDLELGTLARAGRIDLRSQFLAGYVNLDVQLSGPVHQLSMIAPVR
jgi:hypothetical protein